MSETLQSVGRQISFSELFNEFNKVSIPIIQRDYAQGRPGQEELRREFLTALKQAIDKEEGSPLDLDFVYGCDTSDNSERGDFAPLDGQQRLTTLFLLHWYLAWKGGCVEDFQNRFVSNQSSLFTYEVRPSSHDFFSQLATHVPTETVKTVPSVKTLIEDQPWFFRSWKYDPTIVSAITMLEEIHGIFSEGNDGYQRLVDLERPRITFQLLELKNFGLSDDLYIKMNARGKPLTQFETFKARFEQHLGELLPAESRTLDGREVSITEYFSHRMDVAWADLFWPQRDSQSNLFDKNIMRLIRAIALICLDPAGENVSEIVSRLRFDRTTLSFGSLLEGKCLNCTMAETLISILDYWSGSGLDDKIAGNATGFSGRSAFEDVIHRELPYPELVKLAAYCTYVRLHESPIDTESLSDWLRVVVNLVENSDIQRPSDFLDALKSLAKLEEYADRILEYLAEGSEVTVFNRQQIREERIKAALMLKGGHWREEITKAEAHEYFLGQIEFLLKFSGILDHWAEEESISWTEDEDSGFLEKFKKYFQKSDAVFGAKGLRPFSENRWERALLAMGNYSLIYRKNYSFLQDRNASGERRPTWKLLLRGHTTDQDHEHKRQLVRQLLDKVELDSGVEYSLDEVINSSTPSEQWRKMLIDLPNAIEYCAQRMFRILPGGPVYLISKVSMSSEHIELWSYHLHETILTKLRDEGNLEPFTLSYQAANDDYIPSACLTWNDASIEIDYVDGKYRLSFENSDTESHKYLIGELKESHEIDEDGEWDYLRVPRDEITSALQRVVCIAREYVESTY